MISTEDHKMNKPVRYEDATYKTVDQVIADTNLCRRKVIQLVEEAGALIRIDRLIRINATKIYHKS